MLFSELTSHLSFCLSYFKGLPERWAWNMLHICMLDKFLLLTAVNYVLLFIWAPIKQFTFANKDMKHVCICWVFPPLHLLLMWVKITKLMQTFWLVTYVHCLIIFYALVSFSFFFFFLVFVFSEASDLLFMNLCNKGKQPVLEAITHRPKVGLIYIVHNANLISHFVLSPVCKSSWGYMVVVHNFTLY